jgi:branched-chain amino acid transport system permease protein
LGAYAAALSHLHWGFNALQAAVCGMACAGLAAVAMSKLLQRSAGVYLAMLSLAFAQMVWASASQWVSLLGVTTGS